MSDVKVIYYGHVFDASGFGQAARSYIHALHAAGVSLSVVDLMNHGRQVRDELVESLLQRPLQPDFHLFHGVPPQWARLAFRVPNAIGMTVWETDTLPTQWHNVLSHVVDVWLPCEFNVQTFQRAIETPVFKLPHAIAARRIRGDRDGIDRLIDGTASDFVFYSVFEWQERKGPHDLLRAYLQAFPDDNGTLLVLKINPEAGAVARAAVDEARRETGSAARVSIVAQRWTDAQIELLHARGSCYVSLHRGEGWCYPLFDAAARGVPVIATAFSGPLDYLREGAARLVPFTLTPVQQRYVYYNPRMQWAQPDIGAASRLLREVYQDPARARQDADSLAASIQRAYSLERVGAMARERLELLIGGRNGRRASAPRTGARPPAVEPVTPPVPVPPQWYDQDYFDNAVKSNWTGGYTWASFSGLFRDTAGYLTELFPDARTFLDAGCAKGFLVRCLREAGKECWGVDHSSWVIEHADPAAKPFLMCTGAEQLAIDRDIDVVVALDLLSHLTESQAEAFLARARTCTRLALLASIVSFDDAREESRYRAARDDRDRSHVTLRTRAWWNDLFARTGWRQDALQRLGAERCQLHPLPQRMRWKVYAYSPR
jgi:glycosyltransferase involved in cell wall biosynthesis